MQSPPSWPTTPTGQSSDTPAAMKRRRKSFGADSPDVVTTGKFSSQYAILSILYAHYYKLNPFTDGLTYPNMLITFLGSF